MTNLRIGLRISKEDRILLDKVCEARGEDRSGFIRRALRTELAKLGFYEADIRQALGFKTGG